MYVMLFCIGSPYLSPLLGNYQGSTRFGIAFDVSLLFYIHYIIYINSFLIFMCECVYFMLLLHYMFKKQKKKNEYIIHFLCLSIFTDIFIDIADKMFSRPSPIYLHNLLTILTELSLVRIL